MMEMFCILNGVEVTFANTHRMNGYVLLHVSEASTSYAKWWRQSLAPACAKVLGWEPSWCGTGGERSWGAVSEGEM